ncbi:hypothetical protein PSN45_001291 [Yamadazyma tenuis]|uniref:MARVEL domain-containing protein n=1 Tax=Candida tenuis (strain ATCC 10573 / BCRC 21748 / CBS 615 / JCM 9827 / NBRC 10315 / NRRL Y-1498 / VKM Y-70) TaxID=590646 RepID=G3BD43_CANTC|nr:uncharacterized protein CANTEDRAFT_116959 [Yamadazyma tenuis ATCC 10573]XP_006690517.1 uncharacterized protein CANTEDRAFT_116959 [Yamadazyma tenuis ATCC 10573]EGV61302.1 hypothetical protein CANTEDRAFT_116959 [Yamadazyma tenuis ATCC 10573]EGV61303.1 hypothetical protein CANTEDRAFT_116959 [Yamadazyma tenuis ATCC 10573]WEJ93816.1 hypothetical protein PSN45_001291 [Yamadazyma tenuis]
MLGLFSTLKGRVTLGVRATQLLFSIIVLGCGAALASTSFTSGRAGLCIATAVLTLIYIALTVIPKVYPLLPTISLLVSESVLFILWLASFASIADAQYGSISCDIGDYGYYHSILHDYRKACHNGKALLAFAVLSWLLSIASLALTILYVVIPAAKTKTLVAGGNNVLTGALFDIDVSPALKTTNTGVVTDEENKAESDQDVVKEAETEAEADVPEPTVADPDTTEVDLSAPAKST